MCDRNFQLGYRPNRAINESIIFKLNRAINLYACVCVVYILICKIYHIIEELFYL